MSIAKSSKLSDWLEKLEALDPFHIELGLDRSRTVLDAMNLSMNGKIIMVAGTNGKGSTVAVLEELLSEQGQNVGAYTSPHILHFRERIRIRRKCVTDTELVSAFEAVENARQEVALTYFEFATLAAAYLFSSADLDVYLLEVGLGGRLDAVNLFDADVSVITNISLDHQRWLGDTREQIAAEKAGIYREGKPAIYGSLNRPKTIDESIATIGANAALAGEDFGIDECGVWWHSESKQSVALPRHCNLASENLSSAIAALYAIGQPPSQPHVDALEFFTVPGRHQQFSYAGTEIVADVAHNAESALFLAKRLEDLSLNNLVAVIGAMKDKSIDDLISPMLKHIDEWVLVRPDIARAASITSLETALIGAGVSNARIHACEEIQTLPDVLCGREAAVIYGSFYTVGECFSVMGVEIG